MVGTDWCSCATADCAQRRFHRAAEKRDELAAFQLIELHSLPISQGRIAGYRTAEDQSAVPGPGPVADFWKPETTQAINIGPPIDIVRISQTILGRSSQPEPSASASKDL